MQREMEDTANLPEVSLAAAKLLSPTLITHHGEYLQF